MKNKTNTIEELKNEGVITTASNIPESKLMFPENKTIYEDTESYLPEYIKGFLKRNQFWIKEIEDYCQNAAITPQDLINLHRDSLKVKKVAKNEKLRDNSNFRANLIQKKTGIE